MDRRKKKTEAAFTSALFHFLEKKDLNKITVKELCEYADMNRGTFYLHYLDIYDLMEKTEQKMIDAVLVRPHADRQTLAQNIIDTFDYIRSHKKEYRIILISASGSGFVRKLERTIIDGSTDTLKKIIPRCTDELARTAATIYVAGAMALLYDWVVINDCKTDPAELLDSVNRATYYMFMERQAFLREQKK